MTESTADLLARIVDLEARLQRAEDVEAIKNLHRRYVSPRV